MLIIILELQRKILLILLVGIWIIIKDLLLHISRDKFIMMKLSELIGIKIPEVSKIKFQNGIKLLIIKDRRFPVITSMFVFKNGSISDSYSEKNLFGLCSLTSELIIKGTENYSASEIANRIESTGAYIFSGCSYDFSFLTVHSLKKYFEENYSFSNELLRNSIFQEEEIERLRFQKLNLMRLNFNYGDYISNRVFKRNVYGKSLYGINPDGTLTTLEKLTRKDILNFYKSFYLPNNLIIILIGDITDSKAIKLTEKYFSNWGPKKIPDFKIFPQKNIKGINVYFIPRKGSAQTNIIIGHKSVAIKCPDYIKLKVLNALLGGTFISRINRNLRELQGFTYYTFSSLNCRKYQGDFSIETSVDNKHTISAIKEIIKEMRNIRENYVEDEELVYVKNFIIGNYPLQIETANEIATKVLELELYSLRKDFYNTLLIKVNNVNKKDIFEVANKYIDPQNLVISVVGEPKVIRNSLEEIGQVKIITKIDNL
ncbi:MAG: insulinase family protein [Ignavibacteria bacterium]|nr:insulinase family protein [Ignavibacteria bacterium]